jgi:hypothetical protein
MLVTKAYLGGPSRSSVSALSGSSAMRTGPSLSGGGAEPGGGVARKGLKGFTPVGPAAQPPECQHY